MGIASMTAERRCPIGYVFCGQKKLARDIGQHLLIY
jgi:hypothetical protein